MKIKRCENGHFFDNYKYADCPLCGCDEIIPKSKTEKLDYDTINLTKENFKLKLSYGDFPVHNVEYHNGSVKFYNRINPRDGGFRFPEHFFDEFELILNSEQIDCLDEIVKSLEFVIGHSFEPLGDICFGAPENFYKKLIADNGTTYFIENEKSLIDFFNEICDFPKFEQIVNENVTHIIDIHDKFQTLEFYPERIMLSIESQGKDVFIEKNSFFLGRSPECDIKIEGATVSRIHAVVCYNDGTWCIEDLNSKNGVWINDVKLEPMKKYSLRSNDIIDIAHTEKLIFFKHKEELMLL